MLRSYFRKKNTKENIFIHIPKSGGSTFVGLLKESEKQKNFDPTAPSHNIDKIGNTHIKHVDFSSPNRTFKGVDIFKIDKRDEFREKFELFMLVRNPVDRIISEFNFQYHILKGKEGNKNAAIISKLRPQPKTIEDYIKFRETQDYQVKFLLGRKLADKGSVSKSDMDGLLDTIGQLPIHCGLTEHYADFLYHFERVSGKKLKRNVIVRKRTPFMYQTEISEETKRRIIKLNKLDYQLYMAVKENLEVKEKNKFYFKQNDEFIV